MNSLLVTSPAEWKIFFDHLDASCFIVFTDKNTGHHCLPYFSDKYMAGKPFIHLEVPAGEAYKSLSMAQHLWEQLLERAIDRQAVCICLGGGMLTDLGGFVASTFKRGIRTVYVPTTNLAMCDAAIGGKTGVNLDNIKNQVGTFHLPEAVVIDAHFLETLPERELMAGFAETIKHALIADPTLWHRLRQLHPEEITKDTEIILESVRIKERIILQDIHDHGIRQALNFGHTIGHAVEAVSHTSDAPLLHGEAIVFGMLAEAWLSRKLCGLPVDPFNQIEYYLTRFFTVPGTAGIDISACYQRMLNDKKNTSGSITCSLISNIGKPEIGVQVPEPLLAESITFASSQMGK